MTVSRVLNDRGGANAETQDRVRAAAKSLGYLPNLFAKSLKNNRSNVVGIVVPDIANPFFPEIIRGAELAARPAGFTLLCSNVVEDPDREAEVIDALLQHRVDGLILCSPRLEEGRLLQAIRNHRAVVMVNRAVSTRIAGSVEIDFRTGMELVVDHLYREGCRKIIYASGPPNSFGGLRRQEGLDAALESRGLKLTAHQSFQPTLAGGADAANWIEPMVGQVDAVVCYNDLIALGAIAVLRERGIDVPKKICVVGCDDIAASELVTPPLTTLRVAKQALGELAMRMLLERMDGRNTQQKIVLEPELMIRGTSKVHRGKRGPAQRSTRPDFNLE